jgi:hypothetical protein
LFLAIISFEALCTTGDLSSLLGELSAMVINMSDKDYVCANLLLESCFDTTLSYNVDDLEAVRSYFSNKDSLGDFYNYYAEKLEGMRMDPLTTNDQAKSFVLKMFTEIKEKLLIGSKTFNLNLGPIISSSLIALNDSKVHESSELSQGGLTQKSPCKGLKENAASLRDANLSDFEVNSMSKGWTSAHCSPISSPQNDMALTSKKKTKSRFNELAQQARVKAFHREWPLLHNSPGFYQHNKSPANNTDFDASPNNNTKPPAINKRPSDIYQDNSPSMISLITKDDKKVIKDRVTTYDLLMKNAWYLKNYLRNLPLKKQEILSVIESYYFDDKDLQDALGEHRLERNNTKTLHRIQQILEQRSKQENKSPKKIYFNCKQTLDFLGFFDIICNEWVPLLRNIYEKYDSRISNIWDEFCRCKNIIDFGKKLTLLAIKAVEERKAQAKKVFL